MGAWEALRRTLSSIYGREVHDDDGALIKIYPKGQSPTSGDVLFPVFAFTPNTCPPGYEYYTDTSGNIAVKCLHNTSGALTVTEANSSGINSNINYAIIEMAGQNPTFNGIYYSSTLGAADYTKRRIGQLLLTTDGAGNAAAATAVAALAGYTGHIEILGAWSADSGATTPIITLAVTTGTILGISVITWTSASNTPVTLGFGSCGLYARGTIAADDNKNLTIAMAAGGATKNYYISYRYWYET